MTGSQSLFPQTDDDLVHVNFKIKRGLYKEFSKIMIDEHSTLSDFMREAIRAKVKNNTGTDL